MAENRQVRLLQVLGSSAGGVARHVAQVASAFAEATGEDGGWQVRVAGPETVHDVVAPPGSGVAFTTVEIVDRPGRGDVTSVRALRSLARGADVVHAHGLRAGGLVVLATRVLRTRPRVVVTLHNLPVGSRRVRSVSAVLERLVSRHADAVLGVSSDLVELARRRGARDAARALVPAPPRPDVSRSRAQVRDALGLGLGERLLVTVGRLAPQKGLDTLCEAAALLVADPPAGGVRWVLAGDGPLRADIEQTVTDRALPLHLLGFRDDAPDLMSAADVVVSTAVWEGQPIWLQEALALGAAVVATDAGGTREVTGDGAELVAVGDAAAVAARVRALLADDARRAALRSAARERAEALPSVADVVESLTTLYLGAPSGR